MGIGKRLKEARVNRGLTQQELADMVGVTGGAIGNYENETSHPRDTVLYALINALCIDANFLFQDVMQNITSARSPSTFPITGEDRDPEYTRKYNALDKAARARIKNVLDYEYEKQLEEQEEDCLYLTHPSMLLCAGYGNYLDDNMEYEKIKVLKNKYTYGATHVIDLSGDSMEPEFHDGDRLIVTATKGENPIFGRVGVFIVNNVAYLRQLLDGRLHAYNPGYDDIVLSEYDRVDYVGYVVGILDDSWIVG